MNIRTVVSAHLNRERLDVFIAVIVPLVLMIESGYACGWVFANGELPLNHANTYLALARGLFLEGLIFAMFKLIRIYIVKKRWLLTVIPFVIGTVGMIVSAGCNLGWINRSGEMIAVVNLVSEIMPGPMTDVFKLGLGLLFPLAVGAFALFDVTDLVDEMLQSSHLDSQAFEVRKAEMHKKQVDKLTKEAIAETEADYRDIVKADVQRVVQQVRQGDWSFGLSNLKKTASPSPSVTRIQPAGAPTQLLPPGGQAPFPALPNTALSGQFGPAPMPPSGNTQNIQVPPPPQPQSQPARNFFGIKY